MKWHRTLNYLKNLDWVPGPGNPIGLSFRFFGEMRGGDRVPEEAGAYREYVSGRLDQLRRTAYLLCGDWYAADDLVSVALVKLLRHWRRVSTMENIDAYVRRTMLRAWLDERRRPWRRERATWAVPERPDEHDPPDQIVDRLTILVHLAALPPGRRAVVVLRYFNDLSVEETAQALGCSTGTVKSQTARALDALRVRLVEIGTEET